MNTPRPHNARFVWCDSSGLGRNAHILFRKSIELTAPTSSATLSLFADTHYQLCVNGEFVNYGPVRFDPRYPLFDTYDISPLLHTGTNVIAVIVNYFGHKTFKAIPNHGGFIAWGTITDSDGKSKDLTTSRSSSWRCVKSQAYAYAPKMSFALNAAERFVQELDFDGWRSANYDDSGWEPCTELENQESWGELAPRSIALMSDAAVPLNNLRATLPLNNSDKVISFTVQTPNHGEIHSAEQKKAVAFKTWVYSPVAQTISAGTFWSDSWLNGEKLPMGIESKTKALRYNQPWALNKGWNFLCGYIGLYQDIVDHYLSIPAGRGVVLSANKEIGCASNASHTGLFALEQHNSSFPFVEKDKTDTALEWFAVDGTHNAQSPCLETGWDTFGEVVEQLTCEALPGHIFTPERYPQGFALAFDLGQMHLAFPRIELCGVAGATIDCTYSEHLMQDNLHLLHGHGYLGGDRVICSKDSIDWYPVHPKGMRYFTVTVRNITGPVTIRNISLRSARYPAVQTGSFSCSDPQLTAIWNQCARTQACNMEDAYVDCSGRERGMYLRDTIIQYFVNLAVFGDQALMGRCMQLYGQSPDSTGKFRAVYPNEGDYTISDFALNALEGYEAYYQGSGDLDRIKEDWAAICGNLNWFHRLADERTDLLLDSEWHTRQGVSAHYGGFHGDLHVAPGILDNTGIHCVFSCTYLIALRCAVRLAELVEDLPQLTDFKRRIAILEKSIPDLFWDETAGAFADNQNHNVFSPHATLFAFRAGIVGAQHVEKARCYLRKSLASLFLNGFDPSDGVLMSPSFAFYIFDGLYCADLPEVAQDLIRQGWGWALAQGMPTCPEYFSHTASLCHAWSASPAWYLSKFVLGVTYPNAPDFSVVRVDIKAPGISEAKGSVPHPEGVVSIQWHTDQNGSKVIDSVDVPEGVEVEIL